MAKRHPIPSDILPEHIVALVDSREQYPLDLSPLKTQVKGLSTGDYSCVGMENLVAIERKSLSDALGCLGGERERFEKELMRMLAYPVRCLVIESSWKELEEGNWRSQITPSSAIGSLLSWQNMGIPIMMADNHERAGRFVSRMLFMAARRRIRENRGIMAAVFNLDEPPAESPVKQ
ncbi:ERCC4 domain-containing protein [Candidatus Pacearchaeota archaeon]|jgi:ERCC4-type nuclease|nr:ERCC4 domain-containing protein [Candidatus Pacearchaeota archaeon]